MGLLLIGPGLASVPAAAGAAGVTTLTASTTSTTYDSPVTFEASTTVRCNCSDPGDFAYVDISNGSLLAEVPTDEPFVTTSLAVGVRRIEAVYLGDGIHDPSTSKPITVRVRAGSAEVDPGYQLDAAHDGDDSGQPLNVKRLTKKWSRQFGSFGPNRPADDPYISYPVIAEGLVFFTVEAGPPPDPSTLYAVNAQTGRTRWSITYPDPRVANLTYDGGLLFVDNATTGLTAYVATTGTVVWSEQSDCAEGLISPPTAYDGVIYVVNGEQACAFDEGDGQELWQQPMLVGATTGAASVSNAGAFFSNACQQDYRFHLDGKLAWNYNQNCEGGGSSTGVVHDGRFYSIGYDDAPIIISAVTGKKVGSFASTITPAFGDNHMYTVTSRLLTATPLRKPARAWTFKGQTIGMTLVVSGSTVFFGTIGGELYGVSAQTGKRVWQARAGGSVVGVLSTNVVPGLGIGDGVLVVPTPNRLTVFGT